MNKYNKYKLIYKQLGGVDIISPMSSHDDISKDSLLIENMTTQNYQSYRHLPEYKDILRDFIIKNIDTPELIDFAFDLLLEDFDNFDLLKTALIESCFISGRFDFRFFKNMLKHLGEHTNILLNDKDFILKILPHNERILELLTDQLKSDVEFVIEVMEISPKIDLEKYFPRDILDYNNIDFMIFAIHYNYKNIILFDETIFNNRPFYNKLFALRIDRSPSISKTILDLLKKYPNINIFNLFAREIKINNLINDRQFMYEAIKLNFDNIKYISDPKLLAYFQSLSNNRQFMYEAIRENNNNIKFASKELLNDGSFIHLIKRLGDGKKIADLIIESLPIEREYTEYTESIHLPVKFREGFKQYTGQCNNDATSMIILHLHTSVQQKLIDLPNIDELNPPSDIDRKDVKVYIFLLLLRERLIINLMRPSNPRFIIAGSLMRRGSFSCAYHGHKIVNSDELNDINFLRNCIKILKLEKLSTYEYKLCNSHTNIVKRNSIIRAILCGFFNYNDKIMKLQSGHAVCFFYDYDNNLCFYDDNDPIIQIVDPDMINIDKLISYIKTIFHGTYGRHFKDDKDRIDLNIVYRIIT